MKNQMPLPRTTTGSTARTRVRARSSGPSIVTLLSSCLLLQLLLLLEVPNATAVRRHPTSTDTTDSAHERRQLQEVVLSSLVGDDNVVQNEQDEEGDSNLVQRQRRLPVVSDPSEHMVTDLPLLAAEDFTTPHWAGHLPASEMNDKYFFYWLFAPDATQAQSHPEPDIPLIIWLNGGPGCSSMDGLFLENGPFKFEKENGGYHLKPNEYSWHKAPAFTLYIDQPVGTGLSFTTSNKYPSSDDLVNADFYFFLQSFFKLHADKFVTHSTVSRPFYFSGESHAGHYIPSMMHHIQTQNSLITDKKNSDNKDSIVIPLSGAAIGNGWTDPLNQYAAADAAYGHGIIGRAQVAALAKKEIKCQDQLRAGHYTPIECFDLLDDIVGQSFGTGNNYKVSMYDVRKSESSHSARSFPPGHKVVEAYLGDHALDEGGIQKGIMTTVLQAIHATAATNAGQRFAECTDPPYNALAHQDGKGVVNELVKVLQHPKKPRIMFFNGIEDLICNHVGNEKLLELLPWKHRDDWIAASRYAWKAETEETDKISGYMKEYENLMFLKLLGSGHMVPLDIPNVALDMMRTFVYGASFETNEQRLERAKTVSETCTVCPTCDDANDDERSDDDETSKTNADSTAGGLVISYSWLVAFTALGALGLVLGVFRRRRVSKSRPLPDSYDMELREGQYTDDPETMNGDNGETHEVI
jgi:carboxypeptidase D